ncbi:MAG: Smr/MutS family protein [Porphyromonas sp.]|nr:Smr/MutS family protein [Porphyromonas sp.]
MKGNESKTKLKSNIFPSTFEDRLDFGIIRAEVYRLCDNEVSRHLAENMAFMNDPKELGERLAHVREMMHLLTSGKDVPLLRFGDLRAYIYGIRPEGAFLPIEGVVALGELLTACLQVIKTFEYSGDEDYPYPNLHKVVSGINTLPDIRRRIHNLIDEEGNVKDSASRILRDIRQDLRALNSSIGSTIQSLLKHAQAQGWVEKDAHPTLREGRLLLPIIPSAKREMRGIVHDESATGKTLFVEPEQLVEMNNKIREKLSEEKREITRLLKEFTSVLRPDLPAVQLNCTLIGILDFAKAKSRLGGRLNAIVPTITPHKRMEWYGARHPLLEQHLKSQHKEIVPLDITLSHEKRILVISGPNAGGKSATLKTVGLLQYMLQCGLPIPVLVHSTCCLFKKIFLNLGDEQSLENDLSTYSSHLLNMKYFCRNADKHTLILIDEFGSGTEPIIGGAIAEALLDQFVKVGCFGMITTHYGNLKDYSETHKGVINGAMLFDRQQIRPLYQLFIGKPGSSFAIEIARKIGLSSDILDYAENLVGTDYVMQDKYLQDIMRDKKYWEEKRNKIHRQEKELEQLKTKLQERLDKLSSDRKILISKAEKEAMQIIASANATVEKTIREIKEKNAEKESTKILRQKLEEKKKNLLTNISQKEKSEKKSKKTDASPQVDKEKLKIEVGSNVSVEGSNEVGEVVELMKNKARIRLGSLLMVLPLSKLSPSIKEATGIIKRKPAVIESLDDDRRLNFKPQLDCRGMRVDEAMQSVTYFIDDAVRFAYSPVRILHGTGTGALREAIRQQLGGMPLVKKFKDEHVDLGGAGITVVELDI